MRRLLFIFLSILISFIMQTTVFRVLDFSGIVPNLMIILTSSYAFMRGDKSGMVVGMFCGLLVDIFFGTYLGFYALIYMYIGFIIGKFNKIFFPENILLPLALIVSSDFLFGFICYVLLFMFRNKFNITYYTINVILPEVVYTALVAVFIYPVLIKINSYLEDIEQRSAKKFV
ncbi:MULTISPECIES: rod shape-determining protein MreD [unclassified Butyrivibrio]|uniref:rod shape-determining protein MreD n=1 Tax=unclassified Butyrivibrio TaxID=2639466 RepID=UPI0003B4D580|nr:MULTISPECIES: rod shape-determining protein MreD [unclassified Butyrivibrio]SDB30503.1 rod shape-determining protein MreD [Butyrivibrio sp. INlla16]SEK35973.1 rod shape-determining protein MreD [Butyrivibrio sp. ob235]